MHPWLGLGYVVRASKAVWDGQAAAFLAVSVLHTHCSSSHLFSLNPKRALELGGMINAQILESIAGFLKF